MSHKDLIESMVDIFANELYEDRLPSYENMNTAMTHAFNAVVVPKLSQVYRERNIAAINFIAAVLDAGWEAGVMPDPRGESYWPILMAQSQSKKYQISWHIPPADQDLIKAFPEVNIKWDGTYESRTAENMLKHLEEITAATNT